MVVLTQVRGRLRRIIVNRHRLSESPALPHTTLVEWRAATETSSAFLSSNLFNTIDPRLFQGLEQET